ncbi:MAG: TlpA family protein disulfide reductase [Deltaproteobacteria bacterium]|nr:MAG: TlpA family protein disulfide reductase [Deltaproteobacteria bacterium]
MKKQIPLFFILLALVLAPALAGAVEVGRPAPGFTLKALDGKSVSLADFKGRVVLLKLATTWCPSCGQMSREIASLGDFLKERDVVFVEVFLQDSPEMIARYLEGKSFPMTHVVLLDDMQVYKGYNIYIIPRLLVVDREQKVRYDNGAAATFLPAAEIRKMLEAAGA